MCSVSWLVSIPIFDAATGQYQVKQYTGDETRTRIKMDNPDWVVEVTKRGAGEIVLNMMNQDGVRQGLI